MRALKFGDIIKVASVRKSAGLSSEGGSIQIHKILPIKFMNRLKSKRSAEKCPFKVKCHERNVPPSTQSGAVGSTFKLFSQPFHGAGQESTLVPKVGEVKDKIN